MHRDGTGSEGHHIHTSGGHAGCHRGLQSGAGDAHIPADRHSTLVAVEGREDLTEACREVCGEVLVEDATDIIGSEDVIHLCSPGR